MVKTNAKLVFNKRIALIACFTLLTVLFVAIGAISGIGSEGKLASALTDAKPASGDIYHFNIVDLPKGQFTDDGVFTINSSKLFEGFNDPQGTIYFMVKSHERYANEYQNSLAVFGSLDKSLGLPTYDYDSYELTNYQSGQTYWLSSGNTFMFDDWDGITVNRDSSQKITSIDVDIRAYVASLQSGSRSYYSDLSDKWCFFVYKKHVDGTGGRQPDGSDKSDIYYISQPVKFNDSPGIGLPATPVQEGYTFEGWYYDAAFIRPYVNGDIIFPSTQLFPKMTLNSYQVNVYGYNGVIISSGKRPYGTTIEVASLPVPTVEGYTFIGWYTDSALTSPVNTSFTVNGNCNLYAKYTLNTYHYYVYGLNNVLIGSGDVVYGAAVPTPTAPNVNGYSFVGWFADSALTIPFSATTVTSDLYYYAAYSAITRTYTVYGYNNVVLASGSVNYGSRIPEAALIAPAVSGYSFEGWYSDSSFVNAFDTAQLLTSNAVVYARYVPGSCKVDIYTFSGSLKHLSLSIGSVIPSVELSAPAVDGYTFDAWYLDSNFRTLFNVNSAIVSDISLYPKYIGSTYTYNVYGFSDAVINNGSVAHGALINVSSLSAPTVTGYTFAGWYTDAGRVSAFDSSEAVVGNINIYAKYNVNTYNVVIYGFDCVSFLTYSVKYGSLASNYLAAAPVAGHTFYGWYYDINFTDPFDPTTLVTSDLTIYPYYTLNSYVYRVYGFSGGLLYSDTISYGAALPISNFIPPIVTGYTFSGWYRDSACTYVFNASSGITGNVNIYAKYVINRYSIVVYGHNNTVLYNGVADYSSVLSPAVLSAPGVAGYTFTDWYTDSSFSTVYIQGSGIYNNLSIYAKYEANVLDYVVYGFNNVKLDQGRVNYGELITPVTAPQVSGYTFAGWYLDSGYNYAYSFSSFTYADMNIYAKYVLENTPIDLTEYTVNMYDKDGNLMSATTMRYGDIFALNEIPMEGYTWLGWYRDEARTQAYTDTVCRGNLDLYAGYQPITYVVTIMVDGAEYATVTVPYGGSLSSTQTGGSLIENFETITTDQLFQTAYDPTEVVTGDTTLYAVLKSESGSDFFQNNWRFLTGGAAGLLLIVGIVVAINKIRKQKKTY